MSKISNALVLSVAAWLLSSVSHAATPPQVVGVKLQDSGESAMAAMRVVLDLEKVKAGRVTLVANQPGHYKAGMSAPLIVEK